MVALDGRRGMVWLKLSTLRKQALPPSPTSRNVACESLGTLHNRGGALTVRRRTLVVGYKLSTGLWGRGRLWECPHDGHLPGTCCVRVSRLRFVTAPVLPSSVCGADICHAVTPGSPSRHIQQGLDLR